jgi:hypothetical protein
MMTDGTNMIRPAAAAMLNVNVGLLRWAGRIGFPRLGAKQLGLLHELQPGAVRVAVLVDPNFPLTEFFVSFMALPLPAASNTVVINARCSLRFVLLFLM